MPKTGSTGEAMAMLEEWRRGQLADARDVAMELIDRNGFTSSRAVQEVMAERDLIDEALGNNWVGAIFNHPQFAWTGRWEYPRDEQLASAKNKAHAWRPIKVWTFSKNKTIWVA